MQRTAQIARAHDKKVYVRRGAQNIEIKGAEALRRLELDKGVVSFEKQPVDADLAVLTKSENLARFVKEVVPLQTPAAFVRKQSLSRGGKPIVAGVLLFAEEPQSFLPKSGVKLYRYKTASAVGTRETLAGDPAAIEGTTYDVIAEAVKKTVSMLEGIQRLGPKGFEPVVYRDARARRRRGGNEPARPQTSMNNVSADQLKRAVESKHGGRATSVAAVDAAARKLGGNRVTVQLRDLFRRPLSTKELAPFDAVVLDPPRAGAAAQSAELAGSKVKRIVYGSCDPASFARDVRTL